MHKEKDARMRARRARRRAGRVAALRPDAPKAPSSSRARPHACMHARICVTHPSREACMRTCVRAYLGRVLPWRAAAGAAARLAGCCAGPRRHGSRCGTTHPPPPARIHTRIHTRSMHKLDAALLLGAASRARGTGAHRFSMTARFGRSQLPQVHTWLCWRTSSSAGARLWSSKNWRDHAPTRAFSALYCRTAAPSSTWQHGFHARSVAWASRQQRHAGLLGRAWVRQRSCRAAPIQLTSFQVVLLPVLCGLHNGMKDFICIVVAPGQSQRGHHVHTTLLSASAPQFLVAGGARHGQGLASLPGKAAAEMWAHP